MFVSQSQEKVLRKRVLQIFSVKIWKLNEWLIYLINLFAGQVLILQALSKVPGEGKVGKFRRKKIHRLQKMGGFWRDIAAEKFKGKHNCVTLIKSFFKGRNDADAQSSVHVGVWLNHFKSKFGRRNGKEWVVVSISAHRLITAKS